MTFINLTPHNIVLNDGTVIEKLPDTAVARVSSSFQFIGNGFYKVVYGEVENLPEPQDGVVYIVSAMVLSQVKERKDVVAPATGHPDCVRKDGHIVSVPGFVMN